MESQDKRPILTAKCTQCGKPVHFYLPDSPGIMKITCNGPDCRNLFGVKVTQELIDKIKQGKQDVKGTKSDDEETTLEETCKDEKKIPKTEPIFEGGSGVTLTSGRICSILKRKRGLFDSNKIYPLKRGENVIGRKDPDIHSDIEINDSTISRRSITINVEEKGNTYKYLLRVNHCTNPIYVNGEQKEIHVEYYIEPGVKIQLGKTTLELK